jgi:hypothetical protein
MTLVAVLGSAVVICAGSVIVGQAGSVAGRG